MNILGFIVCGIIILFAGKKLSYYGDLLAEKTEMGKAFIGLFLMSAVTSLPELMVGISSSVIMKSADLAVGDVLGSCAFNLFILSILESFYKGHTPLLSNVSQSNVLAASLGTILVVLVGFGIYSDKDIVLFPSILSNIGLNSVLLAVMYFIAIRIIYQYQQEHPTISSDVVAEIPFTLQHIIIRYALFATLIVVTALFLPYFANGLAQQTGLEKSFIGTLLLAISTSLPEIAVSIAAVKANSIDMAVGNLLGSNIFNVLILFLDDIFYTQGHLLKNASENNMITVFSVIIMSAIVIIACVYRKKEKKYILDWDTSLIFAIYIVNMFLLF
jgi:cation:H+ antiporter